VIAPRRVLLFLMLAYVWPSSFVSAAVEPTPSFERDIKPILERRCTVCHNEKKRGDEEVSGGLVLDRFEAVMAGTSNGKVVVPGDAEKSELIERLETDDVDLRMPMLEKPLTEPQRLLIRRWVEAGAPRGETSSTPLTTSMPSPSPSARRVVRTLDVVLSTDRKIPPKLEGLGPGGPLQLALKVGPMPAVNAVAFRGDGQHLAVGTHGQVLLWDLESARPTLTLDQIPGPIHALVFNQAGTQLAVGSGLPARTGLVRVYSIPDGKLLHDLQGHDDLVFGLAFKPDGTQLASASFDQKVKLWDLPSGKLAGTFEGHSDFVYEVAYLPDGQSLLTAGKDRTIKLIDLKTLKEKQTYSNHQEDVMAIGVAPDGKRFVSAGLEPQLRWWNYKESKPENRMGGHGGPVHQLAFSGDGKTLISAGGDSSVRVWDGANGKLLRTLAGSTEWQFTAAISRDGKRAAGGGWDGIARVWDVESGKLLATLIQPTSLSAGESNWLIMSPGGYLQVSESLAPLLHWRIGGVEVPSEQPRALFENPKNLIEELHGKPAAEPEYTRAGSP